MIRALVIDDEELARRRLIDLIEPVAWLRCIGEISDGPAAVEAIDELEPDVVFLDVQMPGASGIEVLKKTSHQPTVIFTTAYDRYAVTAFELQAVDYLLKPIKEDRFRRAVERLRRTGGTAADVATRAVFAFDKPAQIERLFVRTRGKIEPVQISELVRLEAEGDYVRIHTEDTSYLVYVRLKDLVGRLDSKRFVQIHRSHVVNLDRVKTLETYDGHRLLVTLTEGTEIVASRSGTKTLRTLVL